MLLLSGALFAEAITGNTCWSSQHTVSRNQGIAIERNLLAGDSNNRHANSRMVLGSEQGMLRHLLCPHVAFQCDSSFGNSANAQCQMHSDRKEYAN